jgi:hypothetical protein
MSKVVLNDALKQTINSALARGKPISVAYVDEAGQPQISFRGTVQTYGDSQLAIWVRNPEGGMLKAIEKRPSLALLYADLSPDSKAILTFKGRGRIDTSERARKQVYESSIELERNLDKERKGVALIIDLDSVSGLYGGQMLRLAA